MTTESPRREVLDKAAALARKAAAEDRLLYPWPELVAAYDAEEAVKAHRMNWQVKHHFHHRYGQPLRDLAWEEDGGGRPYSCERCESFWRQLLEHFWDVWEDAVGFRDKLEAADA